MSDSRASSPVLILSLLYPFATTLPLSLFFASEFSDRFVVPYIFLPVHIALVALSVPVFRAFSKKELFTFEDRETAITDRILFVCITVGIAAALACVGFSPLYLHFSIPLIISMLFVHVISFFDHIRNTSIAGLVRLAYGHYRTASIMTVLMILIKAVFLLLLVFLEYNYSFYFLTLLSFTADVILLYILRHEIYVLDIQKDGFTRSGIKSQRGLLIIPATLFSLFFAIIFTDGKALISSATLYRLYRWISSLSVYLPNRSGEIIMDPEDAADTEIDAANVELLWDAGKRWRGPEYLDRMIEIFTIFFYIALGLFIVYFAFFPLLAPLFDRKKQKISLLEYYKSLWSGLIQRASDLLSLFKSIFFPDHRNLRPIGEKGDTVKTFQKKITETTVTVEKRSELKALLRLYMKLRKTMTTKLDLGTVSILSVEEFFLLIEERYDHLSDSCRQLAVLLNKSFFSDQVLSTDEANLAKELSLWLLKECRKIKSDHLKDLQENL